MIININVMYINRLLVTIINGVLLAFRDIYLAIAEKKLHLLVSETLQMSFYRNVDFDNMNHEEIIYTILKDISIGKIKSPHYTKKQAKNILKLIDL